MEYLYLVLEYCTVLASFLAKKFTGACIVRVLSNRLARCTAVLYKVGVHDVVLQTLAGPTKASTVVVRGTSGGACFYLPNPR